MSASDDITFDPTSLRARGVRFAVTPTGKLKVRAATGALGEADWESLRSARDALVARVEADALADLLTSWPTLWGECIGVTMPFVLDGLSGPTPDPCFDEPLAVAKQAITSLTAADGWPPHGDDAEAALLRLEGREAAGRRLARDEFGWIADPLSAPPRPTPEAPRAMLVCGVKLDACEAAAFCTAKAAGFLLVPCWLPVSSPLEDAWKLWCEANGRPHRVEQERAAGTKP